MKYSNQILYLLLLVSNETVAFVPLRKHFPESPVLRITKKCPGTSCQSLSSRSLLGTTGPPLGVKRAGTTLAAADYDQLSENLGRLASDTGTTLAADVDQVTDKLAELASETGTNFAADYDQLSDTIGKLASNINQQMSDMPSIDTLSKLTSDINLQMGDLPSIANQLEVNNEKWSEFSQRYIESLESYYHLSTLRWLNPMGVSQSISALGRDFMGALDFPQYGPWYLLLFCFFWSGAGSGSRYSYENAEGNPKPQAVAAAVPTEQITASNTEESTEKSKEMLAMERQMEELNEKVLALSQETLSLRQALEENTAPPQVQPASEEETQSTSSETLPQSTKTDKADDASEPVATEAKKPKEKAKPVAKEEDLVFVPKVKDEVSVNAETKKPKTKGAKKPDPVAKAKAKKVATKSQSTPEQAAKTKAKKSAPAKKGASEKAGDAVPKTAKTKRTTPSKKGKVEDWSKLSESTLKRKTLKELSGYLEQKGISLADKEGALLKKVELVELVLST